MDRRDLLLAVLAQRVVDVRIGAHRPGTVEGQDRGDVFEAVRLHLAEQVAHRAAVELEHPERIAPCEQLVGLGIVQAESLQDDAPPAVALHVPQRVVENGEVAQPEEVHLQQAERLAGRVVELRDDRPVLLPLHDRDQVEQWLGGHDHARGVHPPLTLETFESLGGVDDPLDLTVGLVQRAELARLAVPAMRGVEDPRQRDVLAHDRRRHHLGDPLAHGKRVAQHPGRVLDGLLGLDRSVGDDLGDPVVAVLLGHVANDLAPTALVEVDVDVRHRHPFRVEEALEQQPVLEGIEFGDAEGVGHDGAGRRTSARPDPDTLGFRPVDEVGDDEEVAREAHLRDDASLLVGAGPRLGRDAVRDSGGAARLDLLEEPGLSPTHRPAPGSVA